MFTEDGRGITDFMLDLNPRNCTPKLEMQIFKISGMMHKLTIKEI